jgi:ketosteroid isomerase-like protein
VPEEQTLAGASPATRTLAEVKVAIQALFDALARMETDVVLAWYEPDIELFNSGAAAVGVDERYSGHDGVRAWVLELRDIFDEPRWTVERVADGGDRIVAAGNLTVRGKASGVEVDLQWATAYYLSARGKVGRQECYWHDAWEQALEAARLSDPST